MAEHFSDQLLTAIDVKGAPACVGIDPVVTRLPRELRERAMGTGDAVEAIYEFSSNVIDAVADAVPAIKLQSACFERYRDEGIESLWSLVSEAISRRLIVILDAKRGDIGVSAEHYAAAAFDPPRSPDDLVERPMAAHAITVNSYLGADGITPFLKGGRGAFALVRTSNPGGDELQAAKLKSGETVAEFVAKMVDRIGRDFMGEMGYSDLGAVVGATKPAEIGRLRALMPHAIFLVPGYGAQGGSAADVKPAFDRNGRGALITASRSVIYAFEDDDEAWLDRVTEAAARFAAEVGAIV